MSLAERLNRNTQQSSLIQVPKSINGSGSNSTVIKEIDMPLQFTKMNKQITRKDKNKENGSVEEKNIYFCKSNISASKFGQMKFQRFFDPNL